MDSTDSPVSSEWKGPVYYINDDVESLEGYCPGGYGYHPVHLGDTFSAGRYEVIHKLGHGSYSTVWLCKDISLQRYVSVKVMVSEPESQDQPRMRYENKVLQALMNGDQSHPGSKFVIHLLDEFTVDGPNGHHQCLVFPVALNSVRRAKKHRSMFPSQIAASIATQALLALSYIHSCGIIHGDLHSGNILIQASSSALWPLPMSYEEIRSNQKHPVKRYDGTPIGSNVPKYQLWATGIYTPSDRAAPGSKIFITDFGEAFFDRPSSSAFRPTQFNSPVHVRPVESNFGYPNTFAADIWTLGLTMCEILGRRTLFDSSFLTCEDYIIREAVSALGPLPIRWWRAWPKRPDFFKEDGTVQESVQALLDLTENLRRCVGRKAESTAYGLDESESKTFEELLKSMLRYEPQDRVTADEALKSDWVRLYGIPALKKNIPDIDLSSLELP
ncbi:hypothetical protein MMC07_000651 [Pseudocyphellaria aurata]|nr:hypothetical protein [Pseudocyphellaria aurata]